MLTLSAALLLLAGCAARTPQPEPIEPQTTRAPRSDEINIGYPVFPEYSGFVNVAIKDAAYRALDWYDLDFFEPEQRLTLDISHTIKWKTSEFISVAFEGMGYVEGTAHPNNLFYTLNLDIGTGEPVRLADRVTVDSAFVNALLKAAQDTLEPELYEAFRVNFDNKSDLLQYLADADSNTSGFYSYFTPAAVGISLSVPHALGDHIEIELPTESVILIENNNTDPQ